MVLSARPLTLAEFLSLPEAKPALEYFAGEVDQKVSPKAPHGILQLELGTFISTFSKPRRLARVFPETRVTFAGSSLVPDLIVLRWDRIPRDARGRVGGDIRVAPDIAVEIVSPGQTLANLRTRCRWYAENGVHLALLVHPDREWVQEFRAGQPARLLRGDDTIDFAPVLPGLTLRVADLFHELSLE